MKTPRPSLIPCCCLVASLLFGITNSALAQSSVVLFQDGFERSTPGSTPGTNDPIVGTYAITGTVNATNEVKILTGAYPGGPSGAATGTNYLMIDRINNQTANMVVNALFAYSFFATNAPFHAELRLWATHPAGDNSWPQIVLGGSIVNGVSSGPSANLHLLYSSDVVRELAWKWYTGSYTDSGLRFSDGSWDLVEMDWNGKTMTGKINGVAGTLGTWGTSDKLLDRMLLRTGTGPTIFFVDDVKVVSTAPLLLKSVQPSPNATGVGRQPTVQVQLVDVAQSVDTNSIQLFVDSAQVTPTITQSKADGSTITTISYVPPVLDYGSSHTNRIVYSDQATTANQYAKEWTYTVYTGDVIFADTFESSVPVKIPFHANAFEGTNSLTIARIGAGRPILASAPDPSGTSGDGDQIEISLAVAPWTSAWQNGVLAVIAGYATTTNTFEQTGQVNLTADGRVSVVDLAGTANQYLTVKMNTNAWNTITVQYANGSAQWNVSVNGSAFETFFGKSSQGGSAYGNVNGVRLATAGNGWMWCDSLTVSNMTTQKLLFKDGFENTERGAAPGTNSPVVGTYLIVDPGTVAGGLLVSDGVNGETWLYAPPNAPQVGTYDTNATTVLAWNGTGHAGARYVNLTNGVMVADFTTPIPAGIKVQAEAWFNWQAGQVYWGFDVPANPPFAKITFKEDNSITLYNGTSDVTTGLTRTNGGWQKSELEYVVGASEVIVRHNGSPVTLPIAPVTSVTGLYFGADNALSSRAYVDDLRATALLGNIPATNPELKVSYSGNQLTLTWTSGAGYVLQANPNLENKSGWVNVPGGGASPVQVPLGTGTFYRLMKPL